MKHLPFLFAFCIIFSSCKKEFASFQQSTYSSYAKSHTTVTPTPTINLPSPQLSASLDDATILLPETPQLSEPTIEETLAVNIVESQKKEGIVKPIRGQIFNKIFSEKSHYNKYIFQTKRKPVPLNSTIYTGFIILGIAIVLALVPLNSLSLLFGLASIVFLYLGFKKYFRRKKWRDIFS